MDIQISEPTHFSDAWRARMVDVSEPPQHPARRDRQRHLAHADGNIIENPGPVGSTRVTY